MHLNGDAFSNRYPLELDISNGLYAQDSAATSLRPRLTANPAALRVLCPMARTVGQPGRIFVHRLPYSLNGKVRDDGLLYKQAANPQ